MVSFIGEYLQYLEKTTDLLQVTGKPSCVMISMITSSAVDCGFRVLVGSKQRL